MVTVTFDTCFHFEINLINYVIFISFLLRFQVGAEIFLQEDIFFIYLRHDTHSFSLHNALGVYFVFLYLKINFIRRFNYHHLQLHQVGHIIILEFFFFFTFKNDIFSKLSWWCWVRLCTVISFSPLNKGGFLKLNIFSCKTIHWKLNSVDWLKKITNSLPISMISFFQFMYSHTK